MVFNKNRQGINSKSFKNKNKQDLRGPSDNFIVLLQRKISEK